MDNLYAIPKNSDINGSLTGHWFAIMINHSEEVCARRKLSGMSLTSLLVTSKDTQPEGKKHYM